VFVKLYRLLSVYSLIKPPRRRGDVVDGVTTSLQVPLPSRHQTKRIQTVANAAECIESLATFSSDDAIDVQPSAISSALTTRDNIVYYVAGFVVRHCKRVVSCEHCMSALQLSPGTATDEPYMSLIKTKLRGALHFPSVVLFRSLCDVDAVICEHLTDITPDVFTSIMEESLYAMLPLKSVLCSSHSSWLSAEILVYYVSTRLHWHAKKVNRQASDGKRTRGMRKQSKLC